MRPKIYCPKCKEEMKFKEMGNSLVMYCPKCGDARVVGYPDNWEEVKKEYLED